MGRKGGIGKRMLGALGALATLPFRGGKQAPAPGRQPLAERMMEPNPPSMKRRDTKRPRTKARAHRKMRMRMARESRRRNR